ncbi:MAG: YceI family protein [Saprospiraceae bacterium]|nr:YceI family protein [Saprospiraceae bacterium]
MKITQMILLAVIFCSFSAFVILENISWDISNEEYSIKFETKGAKGILKGLQGNIEFDTENLPQSNFNIKVEVATLDMGSKGKTKHAKGKNFLEADKYPYISYQSSEVTKTNDGFTTKGELTIRNISKPVEIPFSFAEMDGKGKFEGKFTVVLEDFDLKMMGVGKELAIELLVPVQKGE